MLTLSFAKATLERAVKTFAQTLAALLVADGTDLLNTAWSSRLSVAGMAAVVSLLTSVASGPFGGTGPSAANEVVVDDEAKPSDPGLTVVEWLAVVALVLVILLVGGMLIDVDWRG